MRRRRTKGREEEEEKEEQSLSQCRRSDLRCFFSPTSPDTLSISIKAAVAFKSNKLYLTPAVTETDFVFFLCKFRKSFT